MAYVKNIEVARVKVILEDLLGRDVAMSSGEVVPHHATLRGLLDDENNLRGAIGCDLPFAHYSGAALALLPVGVATDAGDEPADELLEVYHEVANVLSRIANEISPRRVRIDPGRAFEPEVLAEMISSCPSQIFNVGIKGYGEGNIGFWMNN